MSKATEYFHNLWLWLRRFFGKRRPITFGDLWPMRRLQPTHDSMRATEQCYLQIPQELIDSWIENVLLANPESTDPHVCVAWAARCDFVSSIIKMRDRAANPMKYQQQNVRAA